MERSANLHAGHSRERTRCDCLQTHVQGSTSQPNYSSLQLTAATEQCNIQEWKHHYGDIVMVHITVVINPADALTKALGWVLHHRHVRRVMGHYGPATLVPSNVQALVLVL